MADADPDADLAVVTGLEPLADLPVIGNPVSGEAIVIRRCADEAGGHRSPLVRRPTLSSDTDMT